MYVFSIISQDNFFVVTQLLTVHSLRYFHFTKIFINLCTNMYILSVSYQDNRDIRSRQFTYYFVVILWENLCPSVPINVFINTTLVTTENSKFLRKVYDVVYNITFLCTFLFVCYNLWRRFVFCFSHFLLPLTLNPSYSLCFHNY